jgi:hypothetical protein
LIDTDKNNISIIFFYVHYSEQIYVYILLYIEIVKMYIHF